MRIDVRKFLFIGPRSIRELFFEKAQEEGMVEFIDTTKKYVYPVPKDLQKVEGAIRVLRGLEPTEQEESEDFSQTSSIVGEILYLHDQIERLTDEERVLQQEIARILPFGDFSIREVEELEEKTGRKFRFFTAKKSYELDDHGHPELLYLTSLHGLDYFATFSTADINISGLIELHIPESLSDLKKRLHHVHEGIHKGREQLKTYAKWNAFLHKARFEKLNEYNLATAQDLVEHELEGKVFSAQAWCSLKDLPRLEELVADFEIHMEEIEVEEEDKVPTFLANEGLARVGEDLVHIYDTPSIHDKDPSIWVLWSFALFFAIIIGDGGYGAIIFALSALIHFLMRGKLAGLGKRVVKLGYILGTSCVLWGLLSHSFFGISFDIESPIRDYSVVQTLTEMKAEYHMNQQDTTWKELVEAYPEVRFEYDPFQFLKKAQKTYDGKTSYEIADTFADNILMELALVVGMLHIALSFLRSLPSAWSGIGWIAAMGGAYLYFPSLLNATSMTHFVFGIDKVQGAEIGYELLLGGMGVAVVLGLIQHKLSGMAELMNIIQVFADVLSYLRLYALGLAGAMMSSTFNDIGGALTGGSMTFAAGIFIILVGHIVNFVLSLMGGVIHGLRLNFLEWYHYSFEGGGKLFAPLKLFKIR